MNKFKERRLDLNLKVQDIMKFTGLNVHWITKIENGRLPTFTDKCGHVKKHRQSISIGDMYMAKLCGSHQKSYQDFESGSYAFVYGHKNRYLKNIKTVADELNKSVSWLVLGYNTDIKKYIDDSTCEFLLNFFHEHPEWISSILGAWRLLKASK